MLLNILKLPLDYVNFPINTNRRMADWLAGPRTRRVKNWNRHVDDVEAIAATPAFQSLRTEVLALTELRSGQRLLDVGAGTGLLALAAAPCVSSVTAVDVSAAMCERLRRNLRQLRLTNVDVRTASACSLPLADASVDVVVSSYCFHHLRDRDKRRALGELARVMRPGGRVVIADMMFHFGLTAPRDRAVVLGFASRMLRKGPRGALRLCKNALRIASGRGEHPADAEWWAAALKDAGFVEAQVRELAHEGGIAVALTAGAPRSGERSENSHRALTAA